MKKKDLTAEEAYNVLRGKQRQRELKEDGEQKDLAKRRSQGTRQKSPGPAASLNPKNPYPLDDVDKKALKSLQKAQPSANWTVEKYYKMMKGD